MLSVMTDHLEKEEIDLTVSPDFIGVNEADLSFNTPVFIEGEASIMDDLFILKLSVKTKVSMPCSVCNKNTVFPIEIKEFYHTIPVAELPPSQFDYSELLREEILLLIPQFAECNQGKCPERATLPKITKDPSNHFPFADL